MTVVLVLLKELYIFSSIFIATSERHSQTLSLMNASNFESCGSESSPRLRTCIAKQWYSAVYVAYFDVDQTGIINLDV